MKRERQNGTSSFSFNLDSHSGVPVYRQLIDQVHAAIATGQLQPGDQLPTVRLVAVELTINPNTVIRAYREMEIRGILDTQQGSGTFIADHKIEPSKQERNRKLDQLVGDFVARAGAAGLTVGELIESLEKLQRERGSRR